MEIASATQFSIILIIILLIHRSISAAVKRKQDRSGQDKVCGEVPETTLELILGASYNPRYMSIEKPPENSDAKAGSKRTPSDVQMNFFVDDSHYEELADQPAWDVQNHVKINPMNKGSNRRSKRQANYMQEWHCESEIQWKDLGPDYFPRYLRTVKCLSKNCWFGMYKCKPRSFTVKILKRKRNRCVVAEPGTKIGFSGIPKDLRELWVWEEHAVNFCCDCSV